MFAHLQKAIACNIVKAIKNNAKGYFSKTKLILCLWFASFCTLGSKASQKEALKMAKLPYNIVPNYFCKHPRWKWPVGGMIHMVRLNPSTPYLTLWCIFDVKSWHRALSNLDHPCSPQYSAYKSGVCLLVNTNICGSIFMSYHWGQIFYFLEKTQYF